MKEKLFKCFIVVLICLFFIVIFLLARIFYNEYKTDKIIKDIIKETDIEEIVVGDLIGVDDNVSSNYWKYVNNTSINVNFDNLKKMNEDVVGWINIPGTEVNYPYVKTTNNNYYLKHSINKKSNHIGWTFEDFEVDDRSNNIIIYNYSGKTNLADALKVIDKEWFDNNEHIIKTSTLFENNIWQIFSIYKTTDINSFENKYDNLPDYTESMIEKSIYDFDTNTSNTVKIITFITRQNNEYIVIHAKLIKQQKR